MDKLQEQLLDILDNNLHKTIPLMCELCGHLGGDVHEQPRYDSVFRRDTTMYVCDDFDTCRNRQEDWRKDD